MQPRDGDGGAADGAQCGVFEDRGWLPLAQWQLGMAWHPDHISPETQLFLDHASRHIEDNPQLLDANAYRAWL